MHPTYIAARSSTPTRRSLDHLDTRFQSSGSSSSISSVNKANRIMDVKHCLGDAIIVIYVLVKLKPDQDKEDRKLEGPNEGEEIPLLPSDKS